MGVVPTEMILQLVDGDRAERNTSTLKIPIYTAYLKPVEPLG